MWGKHHPTVLTQSYVVSQYTQCFAPYAISYPLIKSQNSLLKYIPLYENPLMQAKISIICASVCDHGISGCVYTFYSIFVVVIRTYLYRVCSTFNNALSK